MARHAGVMIGTEVCKILGIAHDNVKAVDIHLDAGDVAHVHVTRILETDEFDGIKKVLEDYEIKPKKG